MLNGEFYMLELRNISKSFNQKNQRSDNDKKLFQNRLAEFMEK